MKYLVYIVLLLITKSTFALEIPSPSGKSKILVGSGVVFNCTNKQKTFVFVSYSNTENEGLYKNTCAVTLKIHNSTKTIFYSLKNALECDEKLAARITTMKKKGFNCLKDFQD